MGMAEDLRQIGDRARGDLIAVHGFLSHSSKVWDSFARFVGQGHTLSETSTATGTTVDQDDLVRLAPDYTRLYLATFTFKQFVATFEAFFFDFLHRVLRHNPWQFARSQLDFEVVLKAQDRDEVIALVLGKQLNELKYEGPREWFAALNKAVRLDCPRDDEIDSLAEIKATRDLFEHNAGVVNDVYLRKAGKKARYPLGKLAEIDGPYHLASWSLLKKLVDDLSGTAIARLAAPSP
jgi:hypothetical protein